VEQAVTDPSQAENPTPEAVRAALREHLAARGHTVQSDTHARGSIYIMGEGDLASALFEFKSDSGQAIDSMYQGAWVKGLPPRFAVLPASAAEESSFELLEQMRIIPLLYEFRSGVVGFPDLDDTLSRHLQP
jgi:hypothetical protein